MRSGKWILAAFGILGLAISVSVAQDRLFNRDRSSFQPYGSSYREQVQPKREIQYFSRSGKTAAQIGSADKADATASSTAKQAGTAAGATRKIQTGFRRTAGTASPQSKSTGTASRNFYRERLRQAAASTSPPNARVKIQPAAYQEPAGRKSAAASPRAPNPQSVIHAQYRWLNGTNRRGEIRQAGKTDEGAAVSPFHAVDETKTSSTGTKTAAAPHSNNSIGSRRVITIPTVTKTQGIIPVTSDPVVRRSGATGAQTPSVTIQWVKRSDINVGQECRCDLVVKNTGKVNANELTIDAYFPESVRLTGADPKPSSSQDHLTWDFDTLAPGQEKVIHISLIPNRRGELATTAYVRFTGLSSGLFNVAEPLLKVAVAGPSKVLIGESASQVVTVSNPGTGAAHNVTIEAVIPAGLEHVRGERVTIEIGSLNPGESRQIRLALAATVGGDQPLAVDAKADGGLRQAAKTIVNVIAPSLILAVKGPGLRYKGRNAVYKLDIANNGGAATDNVRVVHRIPEGFGFVDADKGGKYDSANRTVSWFVGRLEPGEKSLLNVKLSAIQLGSFVHQVGVISEHGARSEAKIETRIDGAASLVLEIVDLDDPVEVGTETAYEIRVHNSGTKAAGNVAVTCELPAGISLIGAKGPVQHIAENNLLVFRSLKQLPPGKTAIYQVHVRGTIGGNHRFRVRLTSDSVQQPLNTEELTKFYQD